MQPEVRLHLRVAVSECIRHFLEAELRGGSVAEIHYAWK
jgi:hypothetical protein